MIFTASYVTIYDQLERCISISHVCLALDIAFDSKSVPAGSMFSVLILSFQKQAGPLLQFV